jgi:hypothetical protein
MLSHQNRDLHIQLAQWSGSLAKQKKMGKVWYSFFNLTWGCGQNTQIHVLIFKSFFFLSLFEVLDKFRFLKCITLKYSITNFFLLTSDYFSQDVRPLCGQRAMHSKANFCVVLLRHYQHLRLYRVECRDDWWKISRVWKPLWPKGGNIHKFPWNDWRIAWNSRRN